MTQRNILRFWLPLFGSWFVLTLEGPMITIVVNRLPDTITMLAASGIVIGLSVLIESPIINLLATSTAKVEDRTTYELVRRFTIHWAILLTILTILIAFTPLFDLIVQDLMGVEETIAAQVQIGMRIMTLWSAAIAWRRFLQGVLIKFDRTQTVAIGTLIRLLSAVAIAISLAIFTDVSGIVLAACTWMTGVVTEAIYATFAIRPLFNQQLATSHQQLTTSLTYTELFWFHLPLAGTSVLALLVQPLVVFSLARLANADISLAAWPVLFQILLIARAPALAIPEVIIALNRGSADRAPLQRFITTLTIATLIGTIVFIFTPLSDFYLDVIQTVPESVGNLVRDGLLLCVLFPALNMIIFAIRGFLISVKRTTPVNTGMTINIITTAIVLFLGIQQQWAGITTAVLALNIAAAIEVVFLMRESRLQPMPATI